MDSPKRSLKHYWLPAVILITLVVLVVKQRGISSASWFAPKVDKLTNLQERQLETFLEMNRLITTLATVLIGALGAFVLNRYKNVAIPALQLQLSLAASLFAGYSIYSGYESYKAVVEMLQKRIFDVALPHIAWPGQVQFWLFLVAVLFFTIFMYRGLQKA